MMLWISGILLSATAAASILPRQDSCKNQTGLETDIGLAFDITCLTNVAGHDLRSATAENITDCATQCATSGAGADKNPCQAFAYNTSNGKCYQKDGNATADDLVKANVTIMGIANPDIWTERNQNYACTNGSIQTDSNGYEYRIYCGYRQEGNTYDPTKRPDFPPYHAETLDDCLAFCSRGGPLCQGVLYSEGLRTGYRNCFPKSVNGTEPFALKPDPGTTMAVGILTVNSTCTGTSYTSSNGAAFNTSCDTSGSGPDIKKVHSTNFETCMDECANYQPESGGNGCYGVMYEPSASTGFQNCYLKYDLQNVTAQGSWNMAILASGGNNSSSGGSSSKAWIAGVVVGPVIGIALVVGFLLWWCKWYKAKRRSAQDKSEGEPFRTLGSVNTHASTPYSDRAQYKSDYQSQMNDSEQSTMMSKPAAELGAGPRAHELPGKDRPRFEMPG